jgi:hypothetical protein
LDAAAVAAYLGRYAQAYREEYRRLVEGSPSGGGFPALEISPYLVDGDMHAIAAADGAVVLSEQQEPEHQWWIAGGPALMVDYQPSRTPPALTQALKVAGIQGKPIGIYRLVAEKPLPAEVWQGTLGAAAPPVVVKVGGLTLSVVGSELTRVEILQRLTFGAFGSILDLHLPAATADFWRPHIVRHLGFLTADRGQRRFINYLEILHHAETAAWDTRAIQLRVQSDVRRDFGVAFSNVGGGGRISFGSDSWRQPFSDRLALLSIKIHAFDELLTGQADAHESIFHQFLLDNPVLLDVYAEPVSKPRWHYPQGESPLGKAYVEPDFVLRYPDGSYRLVELERPNKRIATEAGQPRAEVTQALFQIAEWRSFMRNHYSEIKHTFPGIAARHAATVVISRSSLSSYGAGHDPRKYREILRHQYPDVDILTYDELLARARFAYASLAGLSLE